MEYYCSRIEYDLNIDGNVVKKEWQEAKAVNLLDWVTGESPRQPTSVKLLWNNKYLYISFQCKDDDIHASMTNYNDRLYEEEVVEVFLDDDCDMKTYIEIEVNPLNAVLHYSIHNDLNGRQIAFARVKETVETAVICKPDKDVWTVELAIPFSEFITAPNVPPKSGDRWRMNLYRIDRPKSGQDEHSAWSITGPSSFHKPDKFGTLIFAG